MLMPMVAKVKSVMNWFACVDAPRAVSASWPSMMLSTRLTPVVMMLCRITGTAI